MSNTSNEKILSLQQMPPEAAHFCLNLENFMHKELKFNTEGLELILAFSGGADSLSLFFALQALTPRLNFNLSIAHLDHGLRETSAQERIAAETLAAAYGIKAYTEHIDVQALSQNMKLGKEEAGRVARLRFLHGLRQKADNRWIVMGHQLNDLAEDVLMRLLRGSGWPALGGMQGLDENNRIVRPLLLTPRSEIETFLSAIEKNWINDPMNADPAFLRNRVRSDILPLFIQENPSFLDSIADLWRLATLDDELFNGLLKPATAKTKITKGGLILPQSVTGTMPKALRLRAYKKILESVGPGQPLVRNLLALDRAWESKKTGAEVQFPGHKTVKLLHNEMFFTKK